MLVFAMRAHAYRAGAIAMPWVAALVVAGCGPQIAQTHDDLVQVCGAIGPAQILAIADDEVVGDVSGGAAVHGDRVLYGIQTFDRPLLDPHLVNSVFPDYVQIGARVDSIDPCGGDRKTVAEGIDSIVVPRTPDEPWLGYRWQTDELFAFDPDGRFASVRLGQTRSWGRQIVDGPRVFVHRTDTSDVTRFDVGDGDVTATVLVDGVVATSIMVQGLGDPPAAILVLRDDGQLQELDLHTGATVPILDPSLDGVGDFSASADLRFVAWSREPWASDVEALPREAWLLDRATGWQESIGTGDGRPMTFQIVGTHLIAESYEDRTWHETTVAALPGLESTTWPGRLIYFGSGPGARVTLFWANTPAGVVEDGAYVFAPVGGALVPIAGPIATVMNRDGYLWNTDQTPYADIGTGASERPHDLVRTSLTTLHQDIVRTRIWSDIELPDDRWLWLHRESAKHPAGSLVVIDGTDGERHIVDDGVVAILPALVPADPPAPYPRATPEVDYAVREIGTGRTGVWRVRFASAR